MQPIQVSGTPEAHKSVLNKRLEEVAWALFLIMIGGLWLMPSGRVPEGTWLIGTGIILLALNAVRYLNAIKVSSFGILLGILALLGGLGGLYGVKLPLFALLLIVIGASLILRPLFGKKG